jgi:hypothetical protein
VATVEDLRSAEDAADAPGSAALRRAAEAVARLFDATHRVPAWASWAIFLAFVAQLVVLVPRHEPWFDEAQAWLVARDISVQELFVRQLRYEGSPGLWHMVLMVPAKLGLPYFTIQVIGAAFAVATAALVAFRSPFPWMVRAGLLFSFVIGYQYAVVARSYTMAPLLLFLTALAWPARRERVGRLALALAGVATISLHGFLIAGGIAAVHSWETLRDWRHLDARARRNHLLAGGALLLLAAGVVAVLNPPDDLGAVVASNLDPVNFVRAAPLVFNNSFTGNLPVTAIAMVVSAVWFWRRGVFLLWLVPTLAVVTLFTVRYFKAWHDGWPFLVWVFAFWVALAQPRVNRSGVEWYRAAAVAVLAGTLVVQGVWWFQSARYDYFENYSGAKDLAEYLSQFDHETTRVYATSFHSVAALPYFDTNIYDNYHDGELPAYLDLSNTPDHADRWIDLYLAQPDVIVWGVKFGDQLRLPELPNYRLDAYFDGALYWKNRELEPDEFAVFVRE